MSIAEQNKHYSHHEVEAKWTEHWLANELFKCQINEGKDKFSIALPPPNVTGELHMGHALGGTIQDILIRYNRMLGKDVLWQIGTDHAGIGTQIVVEKDLKKSEGKSKDDLGREKFIERTRAWKETYGNKIIEQMKLMGFSPDYSRIRYTMDDHYADAVKKAFIKYFNEGLIYRGKRITNWCPHCLTSLSDLEIEKEAVSKKLYKIKYYLQGSSESLVVATTRPETMFGDTAVAINPSDDRYSKLIARLQAGEAVLLAIPLSGRLIPLVLDEHVKTDFGTGALKVTPAHDANDFEIAGRHKLPKVVMMDKRARMRACVEVPEFVEVKNDDGQVEKQGLHGVDRYKARDLVVKALGEQLLEVSEYAQEKDLHDRCNTEIEPYLSDQWYVSMKKLAKLALDCEASGKTRFVPERYTALYRNWLENIQDWCISRQIWWGHQIPVYYYQAHSTDANPFEDGQDFLEDRDDGAVLRYYAAETPRDPSHRQDVDVLDTWFSSALWPFETLKSEQGSNQLSDWDTKVYKSFYPTTVLATAREIINLWVTRMIFSSMYFEGQEPFKHVLIHPVVQTPDGKRMSKSKGNAIDPLEMIAKYGADASRMWYASVGVLGNQDVKFPGQRDKDKSWASDTFEQYRKFANKLFNAARFVSMKLNEGQGFKPSLPMTWDKSKFNLADIWILDKYASLLDTVNRAYEIYDLGTVQKSIYEFIWFDFCDWYIEATKVKQGADDATQKQILFYLLEASLRLLHPIMPFITEELWQNLRASYDCADIDETIIDTGLEARYQGSVSFAKYPRAYPEIFKDSGKSAEQMEYVVKLISLLRNARQSLNISWSNALDLYYQASSQTELEALSSASAFIQEMVKVGRLAQLETELAKPVSVFVHGDAKFVIPLAGIVDLDKLKASIINKISKLDKDILGLESRLKSPNFVENAAKDKVEETKASLAALVEQKRLYQVELDAL